jgi:hypothetical protein
MDRDRMNAKNEMEEKDRKGRRRTQRKREKKGSNLYNVLCFQL